MTVSSLEESMPEENAKLGITISVYDLRRLRYWARVHGKTPTAYAGQLISARIESDFDQIEKQLTEIALSKGLSVQELKTQWDAEAEGND